VLLPVILIVLYSALVWHRSSLTTIMASCAAWRAKELRRQNATEWKAVVRDMREHQILNYSIELRRPLPFARRRMLFKHFPKAGGSFIKGVLDAALPGGFDLLKEFAPVSAGLGTTRFVVAAVREPCSYYVSLWAYGSLGRGAFRASFEKEHGKGQTNLVYGHTKPFSSADDTIRFAAWVRHADIHGTMSARFLEFFGTAPGVDCWVNTGNMSATLHACLHAFELQGGAVDWAGFRRAEREAVEAHRRLADQGYNGSPHASCESYYTPELAEYVEDGFDRRVYEAFGWAGCCSTSCPRCGVADTNPNGSELTGQASCEPTWLAPAIAALAVVLYGAVLACAACHRQKRRVRPTRATPIDVEKDPAQPEVKSSCSNAAGGLSARSTSDPHGKHAVRGKCRVYQKMGDYFSEVTEDAPLGL
jgi:hypothetical protein